MSSTPNGSGVTILFRVDHDASVDVYGPQAGCRGLPENAQNLINCVNFTFGNRDFHWWAHHYVLGQNRFLSRSSRKPVWTMVAPRDLNWVLLCHSWLQSSKRNVWIWWSTLGLNKSKCPKNSKKVRLSSLSDELFHFHFFLKKWHFYSPLCKILKMEKSSLCLALLSDLLW